LPLFTELPRTCVLGNTASQLATPSGAPSSCRSGTPPQRCVPDNAPPARSPRAGLRTAPTARGEWPTKRSEELLSRRRVSSGRDSRGFRSTRFLQALIPFRHRPKTMKPSKPQVHNATTYNNFRVSWRTVLMPRARGQVASIHRESENEDSRKVGFREKLFDKSEWASLWGPTRR
jgi:hypothetical protein